MSLLFCAASFILMPWCSKPPSEIFKATETYGVHCYSKQFEVVSKTKHSKTKTEARSTQISKTKHLNLENEAPTEKEAPKTRNCCRLNNYNFTSCMTQSESGEGSGRVRTSKGHPCQGFIKACQLR